MIKIRQGTHKYGNIEKRMEITQKPTKVGLRVGIEKE